MAIPPDGSACMMHSTIPLALSRDFSVAASAADTHALLADVPRSASHFPGVARLVPLGDNAFRWEMRRIGVGDLSLQTVYACRYRDDATALRIWWEPLASARAGADINAQVSGHWQLRAGRSGTCVHLSLDTRFTLPVPHLLAHAAGHVLALELGRQVDTYVANLTRTLGRG